jgi:xylulose-5-phosphate/fructose-6-phosphate phosphoketolase
LRNVFRRNERSANFRISSPDETTSNRVKAVFEATGRAWMLPILETDEYLAAGGRVLEMLSEHACEGWMEAYTLTGRHGLFICYEAFVQIADSMASLHAKWLKMASEVAWRAPVPSLNYLLTSHVWRQDQDGYSHQGPGFINTLLTKKRAIVRIYLAPDANTLLVAIEQALASRDRINVIIAGKHEAPQWLSLRDAREHVARAASEWTWASSARGEEPELVLAAAGDVPTIETVAAVMLLREAVPDLRVRVVNVVDLRALDRTAPHALEHAAFGALFGETLPVVFAFHGYPGAVHGRGDRPGRLPMSSRGKHGRASRSRRVRKRRDRRLADGGPRTGRAGSLCPWVRRTRIASQRPATASADARRPTRHGPWSTPSLSRAVAGAQLPTPLETRRGAVRDHS